MVVIKLKGGLGNQMFQYAIGRQLSNIHDTKFILDLSFILDRTPKENFTFRNFELSEFKIKAKCKSNFEFEYLYSNSFISKVCRKISPINLISENDMRFNPNVLVAGKNIYLDGYWQSEKYFNAIRTELLSDFTLRQTFLDKLAKDEQISTFKTQIEKLNSVSIHFRRGDYITDSQTNSFHGTCTPNYYREAVKLIRKKMPSVHLFLFSDDPEWVLKNQFFDDSPVTVVITSDHHIDMYLMSLCKHNIIANSSFSWWGAWLNRNPDKMIIAPKRWFAKDDLNQQTPDLIPQNWIRL